MRSPVAPRVRVGAGAGLRPARRAWMCWGADGGPRDVPDETGHWSGTGRADRGTGPCLNSRYPWSERDFLPVRHRRALGEGRSLARCRSFCESLMASGWPEAPGRAPVRAITGGCAGRRACSLRRRSDGEGASGTAGAGCLARWAADECAGFVAGDENRCAVTASGRSPDGCSFQWLDQHAVPGRANHEPRAGTPGGVLVTMPPGLHPLHRRTAFVAGRRGQGDQLRSRHGLITSLSWHGTTVATREGGAGCANAADLLAGVPVVMMRGPGPVAVRVRALVQSDIEQPPPGA
jgi:hypothetical protein